MISCKVVDTKGVPLRDIGFEIYMPRVSKSSNIFWDDITVFFLQSVLGPGSSLIIEENNEFVLKATEVMLHENVLEIAEIYKHAQRPYYMQLLYNSLGFRYSLFAIPYWIPIIKQNIDYINVAFAECENEYSAQDKIPAIIDYLKPHE